MLKVKKVRPSHYRPGQALRLRFTEFLDSRHTKVVRLSALRFGCLDPKEDPWYSFLLEAESISRK
jgi:hypothetical protein